MQKDEVPPKPKAQVIDDEDELIRRDGFAGPEGQDATDNPIETDGAEVSGITRGETSGRKPTGGAS